MNPATGLFTWTPGFAQQGTFAVPIAVNDGTTTVSQTMDITVLHVDAPPEFAQLGTVQVEEGQAVRFSTFAFDPHNPGFIPQERESDGSLTPLEGCAPPSATAPPACPRGRRSTRPPRS